MRRLLLSAALAASLFGTTQASGVALEAGVTEAGHGQAGIAWYAPLSGRGEAVLGLAVTDGDASDLSLHGSLRRTWTHRDAVLYVGGGLMIAQRIVTSSTLDDPQRHLSGRGYGPPPVTVTTTEDEDTDFGVLALAGARFRPGCQAQPYIEARASTADALNFAVVVGLRFGN